MDATAVSAITRAQSAWRRGGGTGGLFSKAHLDLSVKQVMADEAQDLALRCAYSHPCSCTRTVVSSCVAPRGTNWLLVTRELCESNKLMTNLIS
jgi:hypothetical protein